MNGETKTVGIEVGDVYRLAPETSFSGDKHGPNWRPCGVVEHLPDVTVILLGRTSQNPGRRRHVTSPAQPRIGLTKRGWWTDRHIRPLAPKRLADAALAEYLGALSEEEASEIRRFWLVTKELGPML